MGSKAQAFTASGTFTVPAGVTVLWVTGLGGGGGGGTGGNITFGGGGGGGGAGQLLMMTPLKVTPGDSIAVVIGDGGIGGSGPAGPGHPVAGYRGDPGGDTSVGIFIAKGGHCGSIGDSQNGFLDGYGGGMYRYLSPVGPLGNVDFSGGNGMIQAEINPGPGRVGKPDGPASSGGAGGGRGGGSGGGAFGGDGGAVGGYQATGGVVGLDAGSGGGGGSTYFGAGGHGGNADAPPYVGADAATTSYGSGGGGSTGTILTAGVGMAGYVLIKWVAP